MGLFRFLQPITDDDGQEAIVAVDPGCGESVRTGVGIRFGTEVGLGVSLRLFKATYSLPILDTPSRVTRSKIHSISNLSVLLSLCLSHTPTYVVPPFNTEN